MIQPTLKPAPGKAACQPVGDLYADAIPIFVHEEVLEQIVEFSTQDRRCERGGFLLGGLYSDPNCRVAGLKVEQYVEVRHFLPAALTRSGHAWLTFTHDTWAAVARQIEADHPGELIVGWQHTHPDMGVFLSGYDLFIHRHFFGQPWQVAVVVDPCRGELGFFQWRGAAVVDCGFVCIQPAPAPG